MTQPSREACFELGVSVPTGPLVEWAAEQFNAAKVQKERLQNRGIQAPFLKELKSLIEKVAECQLALGKEKTSKRGPRDLSPLCYKPLSRHLEQAAQFFLLRDILRGRPKAIIRS